MEGDSSELTSCLPHQESWGGSLPTYVSLHVAVHISPGGHLLQIKSVKFMKKKPKFKVLNHEE